MTETSPHRIILVDPDEESREVLARRLRAQGYAVEPTADPASGADLALSAPPAALICNLWMPSISGVQLCRLLRAEPATADVPVILRGERDDPRSRFWSERAGAVAYVAMGRMAELLRALSRAISARTPDDAFFMQLSGGSTDIRDRIARHLDAALFDSVIAGEVRALADSGSYDRLCDRFSQFCSQVLGYRWLAVVAGSPPRLALHHHPALGAAAECEDRAALGLAPEVSLLRIADADARPETEGPPPIVASVPFGQVEVGRLALAPSPTDDSNAAGRVSLMARELGGAIRIALLMEDAQRLAGTDTLTGVMNRRAFLAAMERELSRSRRHHDPLAVALFDVDHFKAINDSRGHAAGDLVLAAIGRQLRTSWRVPDLTARWGGEEFVVALISTPPAGALAAAERLRRGIETLEILDQDGERIPVTVSVGVACLEPSQSVEHLIDHADRAMYLAKRSGRNRVAAATEIAAGTPSPALVGACA